MTDTLAKPKLTDDELADWLASDEFAALPAGEPRLNPVYVAMVDAANSNDVKATQTAVDAARAAGWSWVGIGGAIGLSPLEAERQYA